ncbi:MAG: type I 3-dehydroquinate dehydratase [Planctomycetota bacterium]
MAEVIATLFAQSLDATVRAARGAAMSGADWIELRLDRLDRSTDLGPLLAAIGLPVLVTCRTPREGGAYGGSLVERRELLQQALQAGAQGIDLEDWETWQPTPRPRLLVRSYHNLTAPGRELAERRDALLGLGADVAKIAVTAPDLADAAPVMELLAATDQTLSPTVAFAMGRAASASRILSCVLGAPYVYAGLDPAGNDLGQLPVAQVAGLYGARHLSPSTLLYGLLGNPANHSLGPWLHNRAFRRLGLDAVYLPLETARPEALLAGLPRRRLRGLSVTAPYKELVARGCHQLDEAARATGVVNTVLFEAHGQIRGCNTDVHGVREALHQAGLAAAPRRGAPAVVLGSGGGARAAAVVLRDMGFKVTVCGRSLEPIRAFARKLGVQLASLRADLIRQLDPLVVVHATPVGSAHGPTAGQRLLSDWTPLRGTFVLDMVYRPVETPLLAWARAHDAVPVSGLSMFLAQAREQVRLFTGFDVEAAALQDFLAGAL